MATQATSTKAVSKSGRPKESVVWEHFVYDSDENKSVCQVIVSTSADSEVEEKCGVKISGKYPTNLRAHLRKCHPKEYEEVQEKEKVKENEKEKTKKKLQTTAGAGPSTQYGIQPTLVATLQMKKKYSKESENYRKITRKLAVFIGTSNVANSIVESPEFHEFVSELDQQYPACPWPCSYKFRNGQSPF